jgi:transposase
MIGVDPHKGSHTAVVIGASEEVLGQLRVRACAAQAQRLLAWAAPWPERTWAVEGAGGLGHLLAQQLVAAGEQVLDVPPELGARVRLLGSGATDKNDPNDARSVAVAALRSAACPPVRADDHTAVLKVWAKRHRDLSRARNQVVCRLHAVLCDLVPGGVSKRITAGQAARILDQAEPRGAAGMARWVLAEQFLADLRRIDVQRRDVEKKLAAAVRASGTTVTEIFGVGPAVAAAVLGDVRDISRFATPDSFAAYNGTAPVEVSSGNRVVHRLSLRGNRRMNHAVHRGARAQVGAVQGARGWLLETGVFPPVLARTWHGQRPSAHVRACRPERVCGAHSPASPAFAPRSRNGVGWRARHDTENALPRDDACQRSVQ